MTNVSSLPWSITQTRAESEAATHRAFGAVVPLQGKAMMAAVQRGEGLPTAPPGMPRKLGPRSDKSLGHSKGGYHFFSTSSLATVKGSWPSLFPARRNKSLRNFSWVHSSEDTYSKAAEGLGSQAQPRLVLGAAVAWVPLTGTRTPVPQLPG